MAEAPDRTREESRLERKLAELNGLDYLPAPLVALVAETSRLQFKARLAAKPQAVPSQDLEDVERVLAGVFLLPRERFPLDAAGEEAALALFGQVLQLVLKTEGPLGQAAQTLKQALADGRVKAISLLHSQLRGEQEALAAAAQLTPDAPSLASFLAQAALSPLVSATAAELFATLPQDRARASGNCPVCGSLPYMSELEGKEGVRHLSCGFCQTRYRARRLACAFCDEDRPEALAYFEAESEPGQAVPAALRGPRVDTCNTCKHYIKTADFRALDRFCLAPLDDLASLPLDMLAREQGFSRPTLSVWGF